VNAAGGPEKPDALEIALPEIPDELVTQIERTLMISYLLGAAHSMPGLELADDGPDEIPFEEALKALKTRIPLTKAEWKSIEPELRFRAFTVAALSKADGVNAVKQALVAAIEDGTSFTDFWTEASALDAAGLGTASPWYWETVYRTNIQTAYNAGRAAEIQKAKPEYLELIGVVDERQTSICRELTKPPGTILPAAHPFWKTHWPPFHFGCRTTVRSVFQEEVEARRAEDPAWTPTKAAPDIEPAKGFGSNPIESGSFYKLTPSMLERAEEYGLLDDIAAYAKDLGLKYNPVELSTAAARTGVAKVAKTIPGGKEARAALLKKQKESLNALRGEAYMNRDLGEEIEIDKTGIKHITSFAGDPNKLAVIDRVPDILARTGSWVSEPVRSKDVNFSEVLRGQVAIEINGERHLFSVVLKRRRDGSLVLYELAPRPQK